ncbi:hypothetical protein Bca4012_080545 [Brassica carinata]
MLQWDEIAGDITSHLHKSIAQQKQCEHEDHPSVDVPRSDAAKLLGFFLFFRSSPSPFQMTGDVVKIC